MSQPISKLPNLGNRDEPTNFKKLPNSGNRDEPTNLKKLPNLDSKIESTNFKTTRLRQLRWANQFKNYLIQATEMSQLIQKLPHLGN